MAELGQVGKGLYESLSAVIMRHPEATKAMILEAARAADRLADIDDVVAGKGVLDLLRFRLRDDEGRIAEVKFDSIISEARQQQTNFASLLKTILPNLDEKAGIAKERDVLDEIAQRRAARGAGSAKGAVRARVSE